MSTLEIWLVIAACAWLLCTPLVYVVLGRKGPSSQQKPLENMLRWIKNRQIKQFCKVIMGWIMLILSPVTVVVAIAVFVLCVAVVLLLGGIEHVTERIVD